MAKHVKVQEHFCDSVRCPFCIGRFYIWAETHSNGKPPKTSDENIPSFYECAAKFIDIDARSKE